MCYTSFISVQFITTCVYMTYTRSFLYPQHPAQSLVHNRTLKYFLNEWTWLWTSVSPNTQQGWRNEMGSPGGQYWYQMLLRVPTVYKTGLGTDWWDRAAGPNSWCPRKWLGTVRFPIPLRLGECSRDYHSPRDGVPRSHCIGTETNAKDTAESAKGSLCSVLQYCWAKGLFHPGNRKN